MSTVRSSAVLAGVLAVAGCATRADLMQQDRQVRAQLGEQRRQIQAMQREVERLRGEIEEGGPRGKGGSASEDRVSALERRIEQLEGGATPPPGTPPGEEPKTPQMATAPPPTTPPPPRAPAGSEDEWKRDVQREQAAAGSVNVPERAEYLGLLDGVGRQDCARVVPQLNGFASAHKDSPLADNALYWAARCYAQKGDQNQAITKLYDVVTKYPKGDKAPAALFAQGNLFVQMGDSPDARLAFSKLIRDYPSSEEAAKARQKLSELED